MEKLQNFFAYKIARNTVFPLRSHRGSLVFVWQSSVKQWNLGTPCRFCIGKLCKPCHITIPIMACAKCGSIHAPGPCPFFPLQLKSSNLSHLPLPHFNQINIVFFYLDQQIVDAPLLPDLSFLASFKSKTQ